MGRLGAQSTPEYLASPKPRFPGHGVVPEVPAAAVSGLGAAGHGPSSAPVLPPPSRCWKITRCWLPITSFRGIEPPPPLQLGLALPQYLTPSSTPTDDLVHMTAPPGARAQNLANEPYRHFCMEVLHNVYWLVSLGFDSNSNIPYLAEEKNAPFPLKKN